jgi:hypothetical protein
MERPAEVYIAGVADAADLDQLGGFDKIPVCRGMIRSFY